MIFNPTPYNVNIITSLVSVGRVNCVTLSAAAVPRRQRRQPGLDAGHVPAERAQDVARAARAPPLPGLTPPVVLSLPPVH